MHSSTSAGAIQIERGVAQLVYRVTQTAARDDDCVHQQSRDHERQHVAEPAPRRPHGRASGPVPVPRSAVIGQPASSFATSVKRRSYAAVIRVIAAR